MSLSLLLIAQHPKISINQLLLTQFAIIIYINYVKCFLLLYQLLLVGQLNHDKSDNRHLNFLLGADVGQILQGIHHG
jgi:hypothetical protein